MSNLTATRGLFRASGEPLHLESVIIPGPKRGEAVVEVEMCTICGSDLHTLEGRRSASGDQVLGHEIIGRIVQLPESDALVDLAGNFLQIGDRVTWSLHASCGECFWCQHQLSQKCERLFKYGHAAVSPEYPVTGGMATHCQLRAGTAILRIPDDMDARLACPANCATATVAAAYRQAKSVSGDSILILGAGMLGLTATAWATEHGAKNVIVSDPHPHRAELARQFGASEVCNDVDQITRVLRSVSSGRGADVVFDFSGHPSAVQASLNLVRTGGRVIWVGSVFPSKEIEVDPESVVRRCLQIVGVHNYLAEDLLAALRFLSQCGDQYPFSDLVATTCGLSEINQAVQYAIAGEAVRVAIDPRR